MDVFAHALWAGAGMILARRRWRIPPRVAALTVAMAVLPDIPHVVPIVGWSLFGDGSTATVLDYAIASPDEVLAAPAYVDFWSHHLHCIMHSAVIAALVTALSWFMARRLWIPLLGWWSHIVIDVFTHSAEYFPSPVLYPFTRAGFDGIAWNTPGALIANYVGLALIYIALYATRLRKGV